MTPSLALRISLNADLGRGTGFLPRHVPSDRLADDWAPWVSAALELPERFHGPGARPWLGERFAHGEPGMATATLELPEPEADRLLTILSVLGHAFRWDRLPPSAEEYRRSAIVLPPGIAIPWAALCARNGHPRVGNLASMVTSNWRIPGRTGAEAYEVAELLDGNSAPAILWLAPPKDEALRAFLRTGIETEALGARVVLTAVRLIEAAEARNAHRIGWLLVRLHGELGGMGRPFKTFVQKQHFSGDDFMTLIQPATLWGIDEGDGLLDGASGPQLGSLQVVDAILGVARAVIAESGDRQLAAAYTSTGGVVALEDERVRRFDGAMQERVDDGGVE